AATAMAIDSSGNVYVTGQSWSAKTSEYDYATVKYNADGEEQWVARYDRPANDYDYPTGIAVDNSGNVYVTGESTGIAKDWDCTTIKYNSGGQQEWVSRYNGPANDNDWGTGIALDKSDNVYVTGGSVAAGTFSEYITIKYNSAGQQQWVAQSEAGGYAVAVATDSSGNTYITGTGGVTTPDYATIKYDALGQEQWLAQYNGPGNGADNANAIAVDGSGNVYV